MQYHNRLLLEWVFPRPEMMLPSRKLGFLRISQTSALLVGSYYYLPQKGPRIWLVIFVLSGMTFVVTKKSLLHLMMSHWILSAIGM
jgi:hypothetical protein